MPQTEWKRCCDLLGVPESASARAIKKAFRNLALQYHPDHNGGSKEFEEKFRAVTQAYEFLSSNHGVYQGETTNPTVKVRIVRVKPQAPIISPPPNQKASSDRISLRHYRFQVGLVAVVALFLLVEIIAALVSHSGGQMQARPLATVDPYKPLPGTELKSRAPASQQ